MISGWARSAPTRLWPRGRHHAPHPGASYYSTSRNPDTSGARTGDSLVLQDNKKVYRGGNNTSELAVQQLSLTPLGRERRDIRSKATWEHASDRTFIDIHPGLGGFHHALRRQKFRLLCAIEQDPQSAEVYKQNFRGAKVKVGQLSIGVLPHFASVLCLSSSGTDGQVMFRVLNLIATKASQRRPLILVMEHAVSFASTDQDKRPTGDFAALQARLSDMGYSLQWRIYDTTRFGLPLQRERLFMIAVKESYSQVPFEFPSSPFTETQAEEITVRSVLETRPGVSLKDLVYRGSGEVHWRETPELSRNMIRMGHYLEPCRPDKREKHIIFSDLGHVPAADSDAPFFIWTLGPEDPNLRPDTPSGRSSRTPPSAHDKDGKSMMIRKLTARELARLYGFPDDMQLWSEQQLAYKHIACSPSPPIADALASAIVVQYFTGPQKRPKAYWDGAKDADLPLMKDSLKKLEGDVQLLRRDLSLAKEQMFAHNVELRELRRRLQEMEKTHT